MSKPLTDPTVSPDEAARLHDGFAEYHRSRKWCFETLLVNLEFATAGAIEDVYQMHRYRYYVLDAPVLTDSQFDQLEKRIATLHPTCRLLGKIGSSRPVDYPAYIRECRQPRKAEREHRDYLITQFKELF